MSNDYCTIAQLKIFYDPRIIDQIMDDTHQSEENTTDLNTLLDAEASVLESYLDGRYSCPPTDGDGNTPMVLTKWVAVKMMGRIFSRRQGAPDGLANDVEWADGFLQDIIKGVANLKSISRQQPTISHPIRTSQEMNSRFDDMKNHDSGSIFTT